MMRWFVMKKPLDRVTEAYFDQMGTPFGQKVRNRVHWVCENAIGETILDVGCSQGITSILLGRESKKVFGIDLLQESIDYANNILSNEAEVTKKYVEFQTANFIDYDFNDRKFDSIILGEVLEHITDPKRFVKKAAKLLMDDGQIIITVPFGINDYFDHKKTYYLQELLKLQVADVKIKDLTFFGKWIGAVFVKENDINKDFITLDSSLLKSVEESFYQIERKLLNDLEYKNTQLNKFKQTDQEQLTKLKENRIELNKLESKLNELTNKAIETENEILLFKREIEKKEEQLEYERLKTGEKEENSAVLKNNLEKINEQKEMQIKELSKELEKSKKSILKMKAKEDTNTKNYKKLQKESNSLLEKEKQSVIAEKRKKVNSDKLLLESYTKEETLLKSYTQLLKRYDALKNSKLGKLTLNYWKWRRRNFGGKPNGSKINKSAAKNNQ